MDLRKTELGLLKKVYEQRQALNFQVRLQPPPGSREPRRKQEAPTSSRAARRKGKRQERTKCQKLLSRTSFFWRRGKDEGTAENWRSERVEPLLGKARREGGSVRERKERKGRRPGEERA